MPGIKSKLRRANRLRENKARAGGGRTPPAATAPALDLAAPNPPQSNTGGEVEGPITARAHHVRLVGKGHHRDQIHAILEEAFGPVLETRGGRFFTSTAWHYVAGVVLHHGSKKGRKHDRSSTLVLELPGQACDLLGTAALLDLVEKIMWLRGVKCTRLDLAIDFHEFQGAHLFDAVRKANENGQIVRGPKFSERADRDGRGKLISQTANIGSRQSAKYHRIYDKGLEQQPLTATPGQHVRWELEAKKEGEVSNRILMQVLKVHREGGDVAGCIAEQVMGCVDFRERPANEKDRHLRNRPPLPWFAKLIERLGRRVTKAAPRRPTAEGSLTWFLACFGVITGLGTQLGHKSMEETARALGWKGETADRRSGSAIDAIVTAFGPPIPAELYATARS